jgi:hypothetical protein
MAALAAIAERTKKLSGMSSREFACKRRGEIIGADRLFVGSLASPPSGGH